LFDKADFVGKILIHNFNPTPTTITGGETGFIS